MVQIEGYEVDVNPSSYMLFIQNMDVPGVIGNIGRVLGQENINVATMQVGRNARGELAIMILNVDDEVNDEVLNKLMNIEELGHLVEQLLLCQCVTCR